MLNMQSINDWSPLSCSIVGAILGNMAQQCSILFYLSVVINMLITMTTGFGNGSTDDFRKFMSLAVRIETALVIVYCFLSTLYLYVIGAFGAVNSTSERYECWIKSDHGVYRLVLYVPLMLTMVAAAGSLLFIWLQGSRRMMPEAWRYTSRRIMLFVIVFLILWTIPTIFRMYELTNRNYHASDWLLITVKGLYGVNGLVNTFVWASSRPFVDVYRKSVWCQRCFCVENTTDNQNSSSTSSSHLLRASLSSSDLSAGMSSGRGSGSSGGRGSGSGSGGGRGSSGGRGSGSGGGRGSRGSRGGRGNHLYSHDYQKYRGITSGSINVTDGDEYNLNEEVVDNDTTDGSSTVL